MESDRSLVSTGRLDSWGVKLGPRELDRQVLSSPPDSLSLLEIVSASLLRARIGPPRRGRFLQLRQRTLDDVNVAKRTSYRRSILASYGSRGLSLKIVGAR